MKTIIISTNTQVSEILKIKPLSFMDAEIIDIIKETVAIYFNIPVSNLQIKNRKREIVLPRQFVHYFAKKFTILSLADMGAKVGNKNHATVLYGYRVIENEIKSNKTRLTQYNEIKFLLEKKL